MTVSLAVKTAIMEHLVERYDAKLGAIEVAKLAKAIDEKAVVVAMACSELVRARHLIGDGNLMGYVLLSDAGRAHYDAVTTELGV